MERFQAIGLAMLAGVCLGACQAPPGAGTRNGGSPGSPVAPGSARATPAPVPGTGMPRLAAAAAANAVDQPDRGGAPVRPGHSRAMPAPGPRLLLSTNEPFLHARLDGAQLVLAGAGLADRTLRVEHNVLDDRGRHVIATDARGRVEMHVMVGPCEDDMSGARFPFRGSLAIDGRDPVRGCARPADHPVPTARP